ncbi:MAG TPA: hypothetical protein VD815_08445 [Candidatus Saccharimonadales bacterium]|nr:hypothetical protein [Candidatus Saccharimonadales bacterium]
MTKELPSQIDKNGHIIDFLFCATWIQFLDMNDYEDEEGVICSYCHVEEIQRKN